MQRTPPKSTGPDHWVPHTTPGFEVNSKGQLRTAGHQPGPVKPAPQRQVVRDEQTSDPFDGWLGTD